ncbi:MAG: type II secretion system F family protein [Vulcanimicrobiota bacterium]
MKLFTYKALQNTGLEIRGFVHADDEAEARNLLEKRGLRVRSLYMEEAPDSPDGKTAASSQPPSAEHHLTPSAERSQTPSEKPSPPSSARPSPPSSKPKVFSGDSHHSALQTAEKSRTPKKEEQLTGLERLFPVPSTEIFTFFNQIAFLYKTGVPLSRGLSLMASQTLNKKMRTVLTDIHKKLESGNSLTASITSHPDIFSRCYVALINSGEAAGHLESMLFRAAGLKEKEFKLSNKIQQAVTYPFFIFVVVMLFIILLGRILVLNIAPVITAGSAHLPTATVFLILFYKIISSPYLPLSALIITVFSFKSVLKTMRSHSFVRLRDRILCTLPVLGPLIHKVALSRFCYTLSVMLESGISINSGLLLAGESSANTQCIEECRDTKNLMSEGHSLYDSLSAGRFFPRIVRDMVKVGEESGTLPYMLSKVASLMESEVDYSLTVFYQTLEPFLVAFMGLFVALIAFAVLMPLNSIFSTISS